MIRIARVTFVFRFAVMINTNNHGLPHMLINIPEVSFQE